MSLTTDPQEARNSGIDPQTGQQNKYVVLSDEERAKGFVRPFRDCYRHLKCGSDTYMGRTLSETFARDPKFYGGTFCVGCKTHFPLRTADGWQFVWTADREPVGSTAEEAAEYKAEYDR